MKKQHVAERTALAYFSVREKAMSGRLPRSGLALAIVFSLSTVESWTSFGRADAASNEVFPAGSTPHPLRWTPGISTGPLKVNTVLLFHSSARAAVDTATPSNARLNTVVDTALKTFICFFSL